MTARFGETLTIGRNADVWILPPVGRNADVWMLPLLGRNAEVRPLPPTDSAVESSFICPKLESSIKLCYFLS